MLDISHDKVLYSQACPNLLSVLVKRDNLNTLIINLKPLEQGYSVLIKSLTGNLVETINLPYTVRCRGVTFSSDCVFYFLFLK